MEKGRRGEGMVQAHYTIPLSTLIPDAKPVIVRREDGFEKRVLHRCGRCRVVVGYEIDTPLNLNARELDHDRDEEGGEDEEEEEEGRDRVFYLLPGSLVGTEDLQDDTGEGGLDAIVQRNEVLRGMEKEWEGW
ncbi:hypothetical protein BGW36DRAFT_388422 [Talaromyces proteolyticus]|uniref:STEEP1 domain-containing protein n=1 Tax=Talaromyces proteolyticus TaxID=1131652 RepID=A0AAD4PW43_9EURO|nr:uncharacterized protein BGW36DRAFT_388422 [Talaromyces proteolyticus]KAH8691492.1 hypothetical protein BGW36DRAFT_388422 [Talaromyces proteolyticus]